MADRLAEWREFHRANRGVFTLFERFAREALAAGKDSYSARAIGERIRWEVEIVIKSTDGFKINDHHWPYYARLLMLLNPVEFKEFFETRDAHFHGTDQELLAANAKPAAYYASPGMLF